jgi:hypothetical protein
MDFGLSRAFRYILSRRRAYATEEISFRLFSQSWLQAASSIATVEGFAGFDFIK